MIAPMTPEEARAHRYGQWAGFPKGHAYQPDRCAAEICSGARSVIFHQCARKNGHGPHGLFCLQHANKLHK